MTALAVTIRKTINALINDCRNRDYDPIIFYITIKRKEIDMKVHHIAHYEYGSIPHSEMREKEFPTRWESEKFCEEWRKEHWYFVGAAWSESITEPRPITANDVLAAAVIKKILRY